MATIEDLERRRDVAKAAAEAVRVSPSDVGKYAGNVIAEGARQGIVREAEYRLLTDAEARAAALPTASGAPGYTPTGDALAPAPPGIIAEIAAEHERAMAEMDRNYAVNTAGVSL